MKPSTKKVLAALRANRAHRTGGLTGKQLFEFTGDLDYRSRIAELRTMGYDIETTFHSSETARNGHVARYRLTFDLSKGK